MLPVMDIESERIKRDFSLFPWVDEVTRVEYPPHGITVHLVYKRPVATIAFPLGGPVILDRNGHILPGEDIDTEKLGPLIRIWLRGMDWIIPRQTIGRACPGNHPPLMARAHGWNVGSWRRHGLPGFCRRLIEPAKPR